MPGGADEGAVLVDGTVRRPHRPWTPTVQHLLGHLGTRGFAGAPRPLGFDDLGREVVSFLPGRTVGDHVPWPDWVHTDDALHQVARWLRDYHRAVADYVPPADASWRDGGRWAPGLLIGHGDPAPYNAVWDADGLVGLFDWDDAGPTTVVDDLAWAAFAWTPLHARVVVEREGFTDHGRRRERLEMFLAAYGWNGGTDEVLDALDARLTRQVDAMRAAAARGDVTRRRMVERGQDRLLEKARQDLRARP